jgi:hypothetical protein
LEYKTSSFGSNSDAVGRANYYSIPYVPIAKFDGSRSVGGGSSGTFGGYLNAYNLEMAQPSACSLNIFVDYNSTTRELWVKAKVTAVDFFLMPRLRYAIAENDIYYHWGGGGAPELWSVEHVVRKMLPNYNGVAFNIMPGETFVDSQTYTLNSAWPDTNCYVVVFVQRDDTREVLRSAKSGLFPPWVFGDANGDGTVDVADVVYLINYLFIEGLPPEPMAAGDANDDCVVDIADVVYLLNYLFLEGDPPKEGCA